MKKYAAPYAVKTIQEFHRLMELPGPEHPLISIVRFEDISDVPASMPHNISLPFYSIWIKKDYKGSPLKYGRQYYDFEAGSMSFFAPGQVFSDYGYEQVLHTGWWLMAAPGFLLRSPLASAIKKYGFFSYAINEALHLSAKEEAIINNLMYQVAAEAQHAIDRYSQQIIIGHIELLLSYAGRFYNRQFITRKVANDELLDKLDEALDKWLDDDTFAKEGLPSVTGIAGKLSISPNYLSDMLRGLTGKTAMQHIHEKVIDKAKIQLATTSLSVSEISYSLGFGHPQSFSKLFRRQTGVSPVLFRRGLS